MPGTISVSIPCDCWICKHWLSMSVHFGKQQKRVMTLSIYEIWLLKSFLWVRNWRVILLFLARGLSIIFKILARDAVIWRLGWGWRIHSQDVSHIWLASWRWLFLRDSVIIHASLSPGLLEYPHNMDPSWMMKRAQRGRTISFMS